MNLGLTLALLLLGLGLIAWGNWRERKDDRAGDPPLVPYTLWQFLGILLVILMAAHLITLLTGKPFVGRGGF